MNFFSLFKRKLIYKLKKKISIDRDDFENKSLDELFYYYGSDKANIFKKNNKKGHGFSKFYTSELKDYREKRLNILEIGSFAGASAASFAKYFRNSKIFCFDINISNFKYSSKKIFVYGLDVNNRKNLLKTLNKIFISNNFSKFDIIIDDGSHLLSDIIISLNFFFKYLNNKGIYIIEDFKHPNYYNYNKDTNELFIDEMLKKLKNNVFFNSNLLSKEDQKFLMKNIENLEIFKGNLDDSDICFLKKK